METPSQWPTSHDLAQSIRSESQRLLQSTVSDLLAIELATRQAHWNVKGPHFAQLHHFFEELADALSELVDTAAERSVALGAIVQGSVHYVAESARLDAYPAHLLAGNEHLQSLKASLAHESRLCREAIDATANAGDAVTADVFTELARSLDKILWTVEAHLQPSP